MTTLLSVNNYYYPRGGSEAVFFGHNESLASLGWHVVPFAMKHPNNLPSEWSDYFIERNDLDGSLSFAEKLSSIPSVVYSFAARRKLKQLLAKVSPDVCHAHNIYHHISPSILGLLKERQVPTVLTLHDLKIACPAYTMLTHDGICERCRDGRIYNVVMHRCIKGSAAMSTILMFEAGLHRLLGSYRRCVSRFVVPSRFHINKFCEWGMPREQFTHVPNFVNADNFQPQFAPGSSFLYFGRISPEKGLATLIQAAARAQCPLKIVGTGPALEEMQRLANDVGAEVTFPGYLSGTRLHEAVRTARAVVVPSECYENAPMSILEAYALGKPVAGSRIGGIPELIREHETGLGFATGDAEDLATTMRALIDMPDRDVEAMGRSARNWVEREFRRDLYRERILGVYAELGVHMPLGAPGR